MKPIAGLKDLSVLVVSVLLTAAGPQQANAAKACIFSWAVPGSYKVAGNFRGTTEAATARLTRDCRVFFQVPGVFSGGKVKRDGKCLRFRFKVEGERRAFSARWCNTYGIVPWKGRNIRAQVSQFRVAPSETPTRQNFNLK